MSGLGAPARTATPMPERDSNHDADRQPPHSASLDQLVGAGEDRWRDREAERPGRLEIDHQLEGGRLHDRQIGWLLALENPSDIGTRLAVGRRDARSIA